MAVKRLAVVVDGTAGIEPYWSTIVSEFLEKIIRNIWRGSREGSEARVEICLLTYKSLGLNNRGFSVCTIENTNDVAINEIKEWLLALDFSGGIVGEAAPIAEGLAEALVLFTEPSDHEAVHEYLSAEKHCILVAASNPFSSRRLVYLPTSSDILNSETEYHIIEVEKVAKKFSECSISLSVISPMQLPLLRQIFDAGNDADIEIPSINRKVDDHEFQILLSQRFQEAHSAINLLRESDRPEGNDADTEDVNPSINLDVNINPLQSLIDLLSEKIILELAHSDSNDQQMMNPSSNDQLSSIGNDADVEGVPSINTHNVNIGLLESLIGLMLEKFPEAQFNLLERQITQLEENDADTQEVPSINYNVNINSHEFLSLPLQEFPKTHSITIEQQRMISSNNRQFNLLEKATAHSVPSPLDSGLIKRFQRTTNGQRNSQSTIYLSATARSEVLLRNPRETAHSELIQSTYDGERNSQSAIARSGALLRNLSLRSGRFSVIIGDLRPIRRLAGFEYENIVVGHFNNHIKSLKGLSRSLSVQTISFGVIHLRPITRPGQFGNTINVRSVFNRIFGEPCILPTPIMPALLEQYGYVLTWEGTIIAKLGQHITPISNAKAYESFSRSNTLTADWPRIIYTAPTIMKKEDFNKMPYVGGAHIVVFEALESNRLFQLLEIGHNFLTIDLKSQTLLLTRTNNWDLIFIGVLIPNYGHIFHNI